MAVPTNTLQTFNNKAIREDLSDIVDRISPTETPMIQLSGKGKAAGTYHEWMTVDLAAAVDSNAAVEGDDAAVGASNTGVRCGNYTQIATKTASVSGTAEAANSVGNLTTLAEQISMKVLEIKRDMEKQILSNRAAVAGSASVARQSASFASFLQSNVSRGTGGANPVLSGTTAGHPVTAATDGTQRALTETLLKTVVASCWEAGATPEIILVGAGNKQAISSFAGNATRYKDADDKKLVAAIDVYVSDFGTLKVVPSRFQRNRDAFVIDPSHVSVDYYRGMKQTALAKTGDSEKRQVLAEYTLKVANEKAHGLVADLL